MNYTVYITHGNPNFKPTPERMDLFMRQVIMSFQNLVEHCGRMFLNEMLDWLGCSPVQIGQFFGYSKHEQAVTIEYSYDEKSECMTVVFRDLEYILNLLP